MSDWRHDSRLYQPELTALSAKVDERIELRSPTVGLWRSRPAPGTLITAGSFLGDIEVLGALHRLRAPADAHGLVLGDARGIRPARIPVQYGQCLLVLDASGRAVAAERAHEAAVARAAGTLALRASSSGRFYARPAPDKPPFVTTGDVIETGRVVGLLEVMKTFHRLSYGGDGLPDRAVVVRVVALDGADLEVGDPILEVEPA